jgi:hypothetical protein
LERYRLQDLQPEDFSNYVPTKLTNVFQSQGNDNTDRIVAQVIAAMTPLLEASEVRITANMKDIHISLLSKIADLNKIVKAQDKRIAVLEAGIKSNLTHPLTADKTPNITQTSNSQTPTPIKLPTSGANTVPVAPYRSPLSPELSERT